MDKLWRLLGDKCWLEGKDNNGRNEDKRERDLSDKVEIFQILIRQKKCKRDCQSAMHKLIPQKKISKPDSIDK